MAALMKEGDDIVVGEQRRLAVNPFSEIAHQVSNRSLHKTRIWAQPTGSHIVHPCTTAFAASSTWVEVELTHQFTRTFNSVKLDFGMPHGGAVGSNTHLEQGFHNFEQTCHHRRRSEIGFDFLFAEVVTCFLEFFTNEGPVPSLGVGDV